MTAPNSITVTSTAFRDGETIPRKYTCDGEGTSPPLTWKNIPANSGALAVVVDDPDAPRGTFTHWIVLDLEPAPATLAEGGVLPGVKQAKNSGGKTGYYGPCRRAARTTTASPSMPCPGRPAFSTEPVSTRRSRRSTARRSPAAGSPACTHAEV
ncbi:MAG TPA: YbhB/YbcL family Raf kinase inhibitor-like protein [Kribbella sp.]